jgi:diadenosine tetraphosphate (Ap4A) HIT family hydrolase
MSNNIAERRMDTGFQGSIPILKITMTCELCEQAGGELLWQNSRCRIVLVDDADYLGFCRVIWQNHVREMTDLSNKERAHFMSIVFIVEESLREIMQPDKMNLASLGNMTPHLHWHVIPRFSDDKHFPNPIWGVVTRTDVGGRDRAVIISELASLLARKLEQVIE